MRYMALNIYFLMILDTFKNHDNLKRLVKDSQYHLIANNLELRNGYAIFQKKTSSLFNYETFQSSEEDISQLFRTK